MKQPRPRDAADKSIRLSERDFTLFMAAINYPKPPNGGKRAPNQRAGERPKQCFLGIFLLFCVSN